MKKRNVILLIMMVTLFVLDQLTKFAVSENLHLYEDIPVIDDFFSITYTQNTGAAWSILEGQMWFFYLVSIIVLIIMVYFYRSLKEHQLLSSIGVMMIVAGTLGNFVDRLRLGYVVDFLDFIILGYDFPVFNVADICLCVGIGFVILDELLSDFGVILWKKKDI